VTNMIHLPRAGAGRGQGLRTALALCALTGQALRAEGLTDEGPQPQPGLGPGNLRAARAASTVCDGRFNAALGQPEMEFFPGRPRAGDYAFEAGESSPSRVPVSFFLDVVLLPLAAATGPSRVLMAGGTHVTGGFTSDEIALVLVPNLRQLGLKVDYSEISPGFGSKSGGEAEIEVHPGPKLRPILADEPFKAAKVGVEVLISELPVHLAEQALQSAQDRLEVHGLKAQTRIRRARGGIGMSLLIWAQGKSLVVGFSALGRRGGRPQALATAAVEDMMTFLRSGTGLPSSLAAFLLAPLVCALGQSKITVDRASNPLIAAMEAVQAVCPGALRMGRSPREAQVEITIQGKGLL